MSVRIKLKPAEKAFLRAVVERWVRNWPIEEYGVPSFSLATEAHGGYPIYNWCSTKWDGDSWKTRGVFATPTVSVPVAGYDLSHSDHWSEYRDYDWRNGKWKLVERIDFAAKPNEPRRKHVSEFDARNAKVIIR